MFLKKILCQIKLKLNTNYNTTTSKAKLRKTVAKP